MTFVDVDHLDWEGKPRCAALPFPTPSPLQQPGLPALPRAGRELLFAARSLWRMVGISGPLQCEYGARAGQGALGRGEPEPLFSSTFSFPVGLCWLGGAPVAVTNPGGPGLPLCPGEVSTACSSCTRCPRLANSHPGYFSRAQKPNDPVLQKIALPSTRYSTALRFCLDLGLASFFFFFPPSFSFLASPLSRSQLANVSRSV